MTDKNAPFGRSLMAKDNPQNRELFPDGPFGYEILTGDECAPGGRCPHYRHATKDATTAEGDDALETPIHVLIASFRDRLCGRTLHNAFRRAANPRRIYVRVFDQVQLRPPSDRVDDAGCWEVYCREHNPGCDEFKDQVQVVKVDAGASRGPTYARSKLSAMVHWDYERRERPGEVELHPVRADDFCMQIDSHMDFSDGYDIGLIAMHHRARNDYAVLSTYVTAMEENNKDPRNVPNLCMVEFTSSIRNWGTKECRGLVKPKLTNAMWGAGLSFHRCHAEINVPVDPYLDNVFDGEEGSRGIRFFTHGYDVYTPDKVLVTHDYTGHQHNPVVHTWGRGHRENNDDEAPGEGLPPTNWIWNEGIEEARGTWTVFGSRRVNMLLGLGSRFDGTDRERDEVARIRRSRFGLGTKRTLDQARAFTGINLLEERMESNKCGNLVWVPYEESAGYGIPEFLERRYDGKDQTALGEGGGTIRKPDSTSNNNPKGKEAARTFHGLRTAAVTPKLSAQASSDYRTVSGMLIAAFGLIRLATRRKKDEQKKN